MNVNYYLEFFAESLTDFFENRYNKESISLPGNLINSRITLKSFYTGAVYNLLISEILNAINIPYICTEEDENPDLNVNFQMYYQAENVRGCENLDNLQNKLIVKLREGVSGFPNAVKKSRNGIEYILSLQNKDFPFIVAYNAYNVDVAIWERLYGNLYDSFNIILFTGNYGLFMDTSDSINTILESECASKQAMALTWCSGFKVFAKYNQQYYGRFTQLYAVTGNYNNANGVGQFSDFEKSTLALTSLMDSGSKTNIGKVFMYFFSKQAQNPFGIPVDVWPIISAKLTDIDYFTSYLNSMTELSQFDLVDSLNRIKCPMINIIASNDVISMLSNNELIDKEVDNCKHIMLNFATHWCLWTHAGQIAEIIKS